MREDRNSESTGPSRRVPLIAAFMSATLPGFGQLYNGQINRALKFYLVFCLIGIPLTAMVTLFLPVRFMVIVLAVVTALTLGVWIFGIIDAWKTARGQSSFIIRPWQTGSVYLSVFLICGLILLPLMTFYVRDHHVQAFRIASRSMMPSVQPGDFIFANKSYNCPSCRHSIKRGDIALFVFPNNRNLVYVKRIIGVPGDVVSSTEGVITINDVALSSSALTDTTVATTESMDGRFWTVNSSNELTDFSTQVKPGHVFVLGDNRTRSKDSRFFDQVPMADVVGRAQQIWLSKGEKGFRWGRFGMSLVPPEY